MNDLIRKSALLQDIEDSVIFSARRENAFVQSLGANKIIDRIMVAPAVDAVEVVRCKDCDNWEESVSAGRASLGTLVCMCQVWSNVEDGMTCWTRPNEFCSRGERKENENN